MLDTKRILQENLKALLAMRQETSRLKLSKEMKVGDGTLGSIQYGKGNPTLEVLESVARFFELETWQLLSPNLGQSPVTAKAAVRAGDIGRWPFAGIKPADFEVLSNEDRDEIEHQIAYKVKRFNENSARKIKA